jgi:hypothetical protein
MQLGESERNEGETGKKEGGSFPLEAIEPDNPAIQVVLMGTGLIAVLPGLLKG